MSEVLKILNIGSGKDYRKEALNIDINPVFKPDIVMDISKRIDYSAFIPLGMDANVFDKIIAYDVLEHVDNLTVAMTNCLNLLKEGGEMDIIVPYDLSMGAWSDPTHVRAFNERSWIYYADWAWYLGWEKHCFACIKCELQCAPWVDSNTPVEQLSRMPRAVESMKVILKKVPYVPPQTIR